MKKLSAISILLVYTFALYCLSFMSGMSSMAMMSSMGASIEHGLSSEVGNHSEMVSSADSKMNCESCSISETILAEIQAISWSSFGLEILLITGIIFFALSSTAILLKGINGRSPPHVRTFKNTFLLQHQTVVMRN